MKDVAISVSGVSKRYRVFENQRSRLIHAILPDYKKGMQEICALKDISFEINRGDAVAIIGRNGGGKSTLLEILTGTLMPTTGTVKVNGRVSALLELGSGFKPEYSGRDNVILNGLLLGLSKDEILARFHEIENFAEIGAAIDRPVKTYSSGMLMRLAFAVQVLCEPEILIVDEALSVGDYFFQQKCFGRLRKMRDNGLTLLFVSHDMNTVRDLCSTAIYLRQGEINFIGDSKSAVRCYLSEHQTNKIHGKIDVSELAGPQVISDLTLTNIKSTALWSVENEMNTERRVLAVSMIGKDGEPASRARLGNTVIFKVVFRTQPEESGHISLAVKNRFDQVVTSVSSYLMGMDPCSSGKYPFAVFEFKVDLNLEAGLYSIKVSFAHPRGMNHGEVIDTTGWFGPIQIDWDYVVEKAPFLGMVGLPVECRQIAGNDLAVSIEGESGNGNYQ